MRPLTARQQEVLELLKRHLETTGMPPTRAEISRELGFKSPNAAEEHLKALARKGAIEIVAGASRGIRIIDDSANDEEEGLYHNYMELTADIIGSGRAKLEAEIQF